MQKKLLTNGNTFKRTDGRWNGVVWYMDEQGERKRKSFSGTSKPEVKAKITEYITAFNEQLTASDESKTKLRDSMGSWLQVFKFPSVERGAYDRLECTAEHQIYPLIGEKIVGDVTSADIKAVLNHWMNDGYAYTTVKKVYNLLTDYFRYLGQQELLPKNPIAAAPMIKKANFLAAQSKENRPTFETVTTFSLEEIEHFKAEAARTWNNGERIYQQSSAYALMLNTGLRIGEVLGLLNSDVDLEHRVIHLQRGVKEISRREGTEATSGREIAIGKLKAASSKRDIPLNQTAVDAILDLRAEQYFGENSPLIPYEQGSYTRPMNFCKRYYPILDAAGLERRGLHSLRHTFAATLVNGVKQMKEHKRDKYSLNDIAQMMGVSKATVSRALRGSKGVGPELRKKIIAMADELNYQPNTLAQSLAKGRLNIIALIVEDIRNPFYAELAFYIQRGLSKSGYMLMVLNSESDPEKDLANLHMVSQSNFAGLFLLTIHSQTVEQELYKLDIPVVLVNRTLPSYHGSCVLMDNFQAGYQAALHLIELNHWRIGFIRGPAHPQLHTSDTWDINRPFKILESRKQKNILLKVT